MKKNKEIIKNFEKLNRYVFSSPTLHIIILTLKCNHFCKYCRATNNKLENTDMSEKTLLKTLDFILKTPSNSITIEFQGGEPLLKWNLIKKAVEYLKEKNQIYKKDLIISIVTNLSLMDDEKLKFIIKNNISICTSLDGPREVHNKNRIYLNGSSYDKVIYWFKKIRRLVEISKNGETDSLPSALMTTTKISLNYPKEIINEYRKLEIGGIFLRPLSPIGYAKNVWKDIGYSANDFIDFYKKSIDYIIEINKRGEKFIERNAAIKLKKILLNEDPNFLDLRSPCGAVIGQLAYNYNGDIYTCDEGRMVGAYGDFTFKIGNVYKSKYKDILFSPNAVKCIYSSINDLNPKCIRCDFKPYCGLCPVFNYETSKTLYGSYNSFYWCDIEKGIFEIIFEKIKSKKIKEIFLRWFYA